MKIRIRGNSLRLRLQKSEVKRLAEEGEVTETIHFGPDQKLIYSLKADANASRIQARYETGQMCVLVPKPVALDWVLSDTISLLAEQPTGTSENLSLLIEKDFTCINPRAVWREDQSDSYPNPNPSCGTPHAH